MVTRRLAARTYPTNIRTSAKERPRRWQDCRSSQRSSLCIRHSVCLHQGSKSHCCTTIPKKLYCNSNIHTQQKRLGKKGGWTQKEFIAIRDSADPARTQSDNRHVALIATRSDKLVGVGADRRVEVPEAFETNKNKHMSGKSYAQFTRLKTFLYGTEARVIEKLQDAYDIERLQRLVCRWGPDLKYELAFPTLGAAWTDLKLQYISEADEIRLHQNLFNMSPDSAHLGLNV